MLKRLNMIILVIAVLVGICACSVQRSETGSVENNLAEINKGILRFSELKNGTLTVSTSLISKNNAVESMPSANEVNTSLITFVLNHKGYDYIEEGKFLNEKTREIHYSAIKQVQGTLYYSSLVVPSTKERTKPYEWHSNRDPNQEVYEPNGALQMMVVPGKLLDEKYIKAITKEKNGSLTKYTLATNDVYAAYMKEVGHSAEENYNVHEQKKTYWINEDGCLIKHQSYVEVEWAIDGVADTYIADTTVELTGYNYLNLAEIGDELPPMILFKGELYTQSQTLISVNSGALTQVGRIESIVGSVQEPEQDNQANRFIKNATIYGSDKNGIIVKYTDYILYEKSHD